jgi:hypothetical protein
MMKTLVIKFAIVICASLAMLTSCEYDIVVPEKVAPPPQNDTISFNDDIKPIFNKDCNAACHKAGAEKPDLSPANAFTALTTGNYVVAKEPENSVLYTKCLPGASMAKHISDAELYLIYRWIYAGAENN